MENENNFNFEEIEDYNNIDKNKNNHSSNVISKTNENQIIFIENKDVSNIIETNVNEIELHSESNNNNENEKLI
jgi:hypothetical protein